MLFRILLHKIEWNGHAKIKTRKNAIVEYLDYQIPVTGDVQVAKRYWNAISIYGYVGGRQI